MDLYEALKSGTSADTLLNKFYEDLDIALEKIKKEEEQKQKTLELDNVRNDFINALIKYINTLLEIPEVSTKESDTCKEVIFNALMDFEREIKDSLKICESIADIFNQEKKEQKSSDTIKFNTDTIDTNIIKDFLKTLK